MKAVKSHQEFINAMHKKGRQFLLLYKKGSEQSECAYRHISELTAETATRADVYTADVSKVRDIHTHYNITAAPSLLVFEDGGFSKAIKGCQGRGFYKGIFEDAVFVAKSGGKKQKSVTVYSTPTCPHCNTLKSYLRKMKIPFRDVDVSKNQQEAQAMVNKSGQQGVPQADINGQVVVGFNKKRINELLEIGPHA